MKEEDKMFRIWKFFKYFVMKWRFRLDQARALFGLITFAALLANSYIRYITVFDNIGFWGTVIFSVIIFVIFAIGGYIYDRIFRLWTETTTVSVERNPYTYVPSPKEFIINFAWWTYTFNALKQIAEKLDVDIEGEELMRSHLKHYYSLSPEVKDFELEAKKLRESTYIILKNYLDSGEEMKKIEKLIEEMPKDETGDGSKNEIKTEKEQESKQ